MLCSMSSVCVCVFFIRALNDHSWNNQFGILVVSADDEGHVVIGAVVATVQRFPAVFLCTKRMYNVRIMHVMTAYFFSNTRCSKRCVAMEFMGDEDVFFRRLSSDFPPRTVEVPTAVSHAQYRDLERSAVFPGLTYDAKVKVEALDE